jgi:hypothetical protein
MSRRKSFKSGDTVVFDPTTFNPEYWENLSEEDRLKYYGRLGYGRERPHFYTFLCEHSPQGGHCVLISMEDQHVETMRHVNDFRLATEEEV